MIDDDIDFVPKSMCFCPKNPLRAALVGELEKKEKVGRYEIKLIPFAQKNRKEYSANRRTLARLWRDL